MRSLCKVMAGAKFNGNVHLKGSLGWDPDKAIVPKAVGGERDLLGD